MESAFETDRKIITVDCRQLFPPEPMIKVLEAVEKMRDDECVLMLHRQSPVHLFGKLGEMGLKYKLKELSDGSIQLLVWRGTL